MKTYGVILSESINYTVVEEKWNKTTRHWEDVEVEKSDSHFEFHSLSAAKKFMREHAALVKTSYIYQYYGDGSFENHGPIALSGNNKTFTANTRQWKAGY